MAFFKEKRIGNLGTVTAVDWGRSIGQGLNYDALNKYYQRKFDQKIKDLELTPQVFDTTLSFLEPKIQSKVLELQNEYKSNADISYRKADFSDAAINARQRNVEILKELANMEAGIKSLEEAEAEFANNPDAFFPHEINSNLSGNESILREAYTELINGDYKTGKADVVKDVYFKNGKTIVNIEGIGDIELNELRPFDQPREGLYSDFTTQLSDIATTASTNTAEASALLTKLLGSIDNDLNYSDIQDLLDFKITIPSEFSGIMKGTLRLKDDNAFRTLFESLVENAGDYTNNWQSFFNPEVRREQNMELKAGVDQSAIVQGVEGFVRDFVERVGNQFITAGETIQDEQSTSGDPSGLGREGLTPAAYQQKKKELAGVGFLDSVLQDSIDSYEQITGNPFSSTDDENFQTHFRNTMAARINTLSGTDYEEANSFNTPKDAMREGYNLITNEQVESVLGKFNYKDPSDLILKYLSTPEEELTYSDEDLDQLYDEFFRIRKSTEGVDKAKSLSSTDIGWEKGELYIIEPTPALRALFSAAGVQANTLQSFKNLQRIELTSKSGRGTGTGKRSNIDKSFGEQKNQLKTLLEDLREAFFFRRMGKGMSVNSDIIFKSTDKSTGAPSFMGINIYNNQAPQLGDIRAGERFMDLPLLTNDQKYRYGNKALEEKYYLIIK